MKFVLGFLDDQYIESCTASRWAGFVYYSVRYDRSISEVGVLNIAVRIITHCPKPYIRTFRFHRPRL